MADGTKRDSIAGYVIPDDNPVYELFRKEMSVDWRLTVNEIHISPTPMKTIPL